MIFTDQGTDILKNKSNKCRLLSIGVIFILMAKLWEREKNIKANKKLSISILKYKIHFFVTFVLSLHMHVYIRFQSMVHIHSLCYFLKNICQVCSSFPICHWQLHNLPPTNYIIIYLSIPLLLNSYFQILVPIAMLVWKSSCMWLVLYPPPLWKKSPK